MRGLLAGLGLLVALGGCATHPGPEIACWGTPDPAGATYGIVALTPQAEAPAVAATLQRQLSARGLAPASDHPDYLVEVTLSRRPGQVGTYVRTAGAEPDWLGKPSRSPWWRPRGSMVEVATIRLVEARSGAEVYRTTASQRIERGREDDANFAALAQAALSGTACRPAALAKG